MDNEQGIWRGRPLAFFVLWRSNSRHAARVGSAARRGLGREDRRGVLRRQEPEGGNRRSFADQKAISCDAKRCMVMEAAPASPLEMGEAEFLIVALDAPAQFG